MLGYGDVPAGQAVGMHFIDYLAHGWDVARATGQSYGIDAATANAVLPHVTAIAAEGSVEGLFGPAVPVPDDTPAFDRVIALSGRDPAWRSP